MLLCYHIPVHRQQIQAAVMQALSRYYPEKPHHPQSLFDCFGRPILAGIAAALIIRLIIQTSTPSPVLFCGTLLGMGILYLVFLGALGCLNEDTLQLLKRKRT